MLQTLQQWSTAIAGFFATYPELFALLLALVFSWASALWAERVVFNPQLSQQQLQRASTAVTSASCFVFAMVLWPAFDPKDPKLMRAGVSVGVAICSPFIFALATRFLGSKFPWLKSAFTELEQKPPP